MAHIWVSHQVSHGGRVVGTRRADRNKGNRAVSPTESLPNYCEKLSGIEHAWLSEVVRKTFPAPPRTRAEIHRRPATPTRPVAHHCSRECQLSRTTPIRCRACRRAPKRSAEKMPTSIVFLALPVLMEEMGLSVINCVAKGILPLSCRPDSSTPTPPQTAAGIICRVCCDSQLA